MRDTSRDALQVRVGQGEVEYGRLINQLEKIGYQRGLSVDIRALEDVDHMAEMRKNAVAAGEPAVGELVAQDLAQEPAADGHHQQIGSPDRVRWKLARFAARNTHLKHRVIDQQNR